jgi:hypothetical protein
MKNLLTLLALLLAAPTLVQAVDVYIVTGQSNGWRISSLSPGPTKGAGTIHYIGMGCVSEPTKGAYKKLQGVRGMGTGLAVALSKLSNDDIVFIQYCRCGAPTWEKSVKSWFPGDNPPKGETYDEGLYGRFLQYIGNARTTVELEHKLTWNLKGLFWHQGESDSGEPHAATYETRLRHLFYRFRSDLGKDLPIVTGQVRELNDGNRAVNAAIRRIAAADPLTATVEVQDLAFEADKNGNKNVHFNGKGCHSLGERMAAAFAKMP